MRELKNIEERILDRALYLMGINKTCDISIRAIAKEANVNISAINYYFRSKEEMLRLVKEFYFENTMTVSAILNSEEYDDEEKLLLAANEIMEYSLRFPGNSVIYRNSKKLADLDETSRKIIDISVDVGNRLSDLLRKLIPGDEASINYRCLIFMSSVNYLTEYEGIGDFGSTHFIEREERMAYLKLLIRALKST
ncbi:TetR/AcrR family transcriptional regulator [Gorillibacterium massiliense]|uniref:TetR/AcrR family transcriptional regulator n=1 Tax=Gorillibacterium massiliense TaxID=1280390 RepID=UPI0004B348D1|nr:TetR/AcrR family transcriptional regulator [Gorillibacterium massiliense]